MEKMRSGTVQGAAEGQILISLGLWCFSQSRRAMSMRVCQPYPVALNASTTSGECLIVMRVLGLSAVGRPRLDLMTFASGTNVISASSRSMVSGSLVAALRIFLSSSSVGKMVPGLSFGIFFHLQFGGEAQTDNSTACEIIGFCKADREYSVTKVGDAVGQANVSRFSVITSIVFKYDHAIPVQIFSFSERVAMFVLIAFAFRRVKGDVHIIIVCTLISKSNVDSLSSGRYTALAAAKSVAGLRIPEFSTAHNRALSGFFMREAFVHLSMVAQAGALSGAPVSVEAGNANSVWATTNHGFASVGGSNNYSTEAATMATIPTLAPFNEMTRNMLLVTTALRSLRKIKLNNPQPDAALAQTITILQIERQQLIAQILPYVHRSLGITEGVLQ